MGDNKTMDELAEKLEEAKSKIEELTKKSKDEIGDILTEVKSEVVVSSENFKEWAEKAQNKVFSEALKLKMNIEVKKDEMKEKLQEKKYVHEKEKMKDELEIAKEHFAGKLDLAFMAIDEATVAFMELLKAEKEYNEMQNDQ